MDVDRRRDLLDRAGDIDVVVAVEVGMDATLQADLGGAALDCFDHAALHLLHLDEIRLAPEVERERALREGAEAALERAHVRVVDVAVANEGHLVADDLAPELVGDLGDPHDLRTAGTEQRHDLVDADLLAGQYTRENLTHTATRARHAAAGTRSGGSRSSRPGDHAVSRARPSRSETTCTAVRTSGCSHSSGRCTYSG